MIRAYCRNLIQSLCLILALIVGVFPVIAISEGLAWQKDKESPLHNKKLKRTLLVINHLIDKSHYRSVNIDDEFSKRILEEYLNILDPARSFFLAQDIKQFYMVEELLDDFIKQGDLKPVFLIYNIYRERVNQSVEYAIGRLNQPFDFNLQEEFEIDRMNAPWPENWTELQDIWRKRIKNDILNLRLTGKNRDEILKTLEDRYTHFARRTNQFNSDDIFEIFTNTYVSLIEPHTSYYSPRSRENFKINMRLSLEGIGAVLQTDNEYTQVRRIVPGGPADLSGELQAQDRIVGVGQEDDEIVDVIGWKLEDVVDLIRGPKNTTVRLEILPGEFGLQGETQVISLIRDEIRLEEQAAKKKILEVDTNNRITRVGLIQLPSFYIDFEGLAKGDPHYRSSARDVRRLLEEFHEENISGLVIDLRGNGGGSLREAVELTGLFIQQGPVVQVKNARGKVKVDQDPDPEIVYDGPLAILVDGYSASASEIFAGAIQDYHRGIIIGEPTFGKGTVQNLLDLDRFLRKREDLGQLKLTIAQFFRVNGDSTQFHGVTPDFVLSTSDAEVGERSYDNAIPWEQIKEVSYIPYVAEDELRNAILEITKENHEQRISKDPEFSYYNEIARINREQREIKTVSLHELTRSQERDKLDNRRLKLENQKRIALKEKPVENIDALETINSDEYQQVESEKENDFFLMESAKILSDYIYYSNMFLESADSILARHQLTQ